MAARDRSGSDVFDDFVWGVAHDAFIDIFQGSLDGFQGLAGVADKGSGKLGKPFYFDHDLFRHIAHLGNFEGVLSAEVFSFRQLGGFPQARPNVNIKSTHQPFSLYYGNGIFFDDDRGIDLAQYPNFVGSLAFTRERGSPRSLS